MALESINYTLALGTLALQIAGAAFLAVFLLRKRIADLEDVAALMGKWGLWIALAVTSGASAIALVHEHLYGLPPCPLCWWQRIFIFPQIVLFVVALYKGDTRIADYSIALSVIGLGIALYHHALQMFPAGFLPCPAEGVSCAQIFFLEFGYITYPMMAVTLFAFLIVLMFFVRRPSA